jgi:hypothetical protein
MNKPSRLLNFGCSMAVAVMACFIAIVLCRPAVAQTITPSFTMSGTVTDTNGHGLADVTMALLSDVQGTQISFTDQGGNYSFNYAGGVSHTIKITPAKSGFTFSPFWVAFVSSVGLTGNQTTSFVGTPSSTPPAGQIPILLTQETSLRALALDSVTYKSEPLAVAGLYNLSTDHRTRVSLLAVNVDLSAGETSSVITANAEDSLDHVFPLTVEFFGAVPNFPWLKHVVVKLPDEIANADEVRVSLKLRGISGNKVFMRVQP